MPDLLAVASFYKDWAAIGGGVGNYMAYSEFPEADEYLAVSAGHHRGRDITKVVPLDQAQGHRVRGALLVPPPGDAVGLHP